MKPKIELLAPAGTFQKAKLALAFGADAFYLGLPQYSLRARLNDFNWTKVKEIVEYAHGRKKKVYLTFNIYAHNSQLKNIKKDLVKVNQIMPDAIIVSDPGILNIAKKVLKKKIKIFLSTQANCTNWQAAKFWTDQGIKRIILARETCLNDVKEIKKNLPGTELEYFAHGAMCMAYSGRCILSAWFNERSANLGDCTQPCRWRYYLVEKVRQGEGKTEYIPIEQDEHGSYILNSKDLCLIEHLEEMYKAGICSFKIEGRTKSAYYLGNVVKIYRQAIDLISKNDKNRKMKLKKLSQELAKLSNREFTTGFLFPGKRNNIQKTDSPYQKVGYRFCGQVINSVRQGARYKTSVLVHNVVKKGQALELIPPAGVNFKFKLGAFYDLKNDKPEIQAHGGQNKSIYFFTGKKFPADSLLRQRV